MPLFHHPVFWPLAGDGQNNVLTAVDFTSGTINEAQGLQFFGDRLVNIAGGDGGDPNPPQEALTEISEIQRNADGVVTLTWPNTQPVTVEYSASLEGADDWQAIDADNDTGTFQDNDAARTERAGGFYRLRSGNE